MSKISSRFMVYSSRQETEIHRRVRRGRGDIDDSVHHSVPTGRGNLGCVEFLAPERERAIIRSTRWVESNGERGLRYKNPT